MTVKLREFQRHGLRLAQSVNNNLKKFLLFTLKVSLLTYKANICARSVRHDLGPNIFQSGPHTQSISTLTKITRLKLWTK